MQLSLCKQTIRSLTAFLFLITNFITITSNNSPWARHLTVHDVVLMLVTWSKAYHGMHHLTV